MDFLDFETGIAQCGIRVYAKNLPAAVWPNLIHVRAVIGAGARHDPPGKEGLAHCLEHASREGTRRFRNHEAVLSLDYGFFLKSLNAATDFEYTCFMGSAEPSGLYEAVSALKDMVFYPRLTEENLAAQREVILNEMWEERESERKETLERRMYRAIYGEHPFGRMGAADGWEDSVQSIGIEDAAAFHAEHYHPGNVRLIFVGAVTLDEALRAADLFAPGRAERPPTAKPEPVGEWPAPEPNRKEVSALTWYGTRDVRFTEFSLYRPFPRTEKIQTVWLLRHILDALSWRIRGELRSTYGVVVGIRTYHDHHFLELVWRNGPEKSGAAAETLANVLSELREGRHEEAFRRAQLRMLAQSDRMDFNVWTTAEYATDHLVWTDRVIPVRESKSVIAALEFEEIRQLALRELDPEKIFWLIVNP